jgi:hypothetical protein
MVRETLRQRLGFRGNELDSEVLGERFPERFSYHQFSSETAGRHPDFDRRGIRTIRSRLARDL